MDRRFKPTDAVIYRRTKHSPHPGPRATDVHPAPRGETYTYHVDKFWVVTGVQSDGTILVRTRRGKQYELAADDPALRKARWWERLLYRGRFPNPEA
ncbi:MAG: hypothetical protein P1P84_00890 [Deferrisomatales bacterium]|nr:hypothetical protein [Deferrisomatales bacterium]